MSTLANTTKRPSNPDIRNTNMKVLVADDDRTFSLQTCTQLNSAGYETIAAFDSMQATMFVRRGSVSAIIMDVSMPGGTGLDALRRLKSSSLTTHIPIIVVSAEGNAKTKARAMSLGAEAFFTKPVSSAQLVAVLSSVSICPTTGNTSSASSNSSSATSNGAVQMTSKSIVRTVMVVDDDRILVKMVCKWLNELGYATLSAFSVAEALKMLATRSVNLVIVDLDMPDVRGSALIQQMKAFNRTNTIRIIVLSGSTLADEPGEMRAIGADDFLQKPAEYSTIKRAVASQFTRSASVSSDNSLVRGLEPEIGAPRLIA